MTLEAYSSFLLISLLFIALPGPNVLVIISTSLTAGRLRGLQTVLGISLAMILQLAIAALGNTGLLVLFSDGLYWLKWAGVAYLAWLALVSFRQMVGTQRLQHSALGSFQRGFWVSLTNPKTILFFSAFLPQFVSADHSYLLQIAMLSASFWVLALFMDSSFAILAAWVRSIVSSPGFHRMQCGFAGTLYLSASALLATSNRG